MESSDNFHIGYVAVRTAKDGDGYIGSLLVIDEIGVPQEFRCTRPIRPTDAQRALYGKSMDRYIMIELLGLPLHRALQTRPRFYIVDQPLWLHLRPGVGVPVIYMEQYGERLTTSFDSDDTDQKRDTHQVESGSGEFQPVVVTYMRGYESDHGTVLNDLERVFEQIDLLEPFLRIDTAISVLTERDQRFA